LTLPVGFSFKKGKQTKTNEKLLKNEWGGVAQKLGKNPPCALSFARHSGRLFLGGSLSSNGCDQSYRHFGCFIFASQRKCKSPKFV